MSQTRNRITILGSTGDLGSVLLNHLIERRYPVQIVIRKGTLQKMKDRAPLIKAVWIKEVETLFDKKLLENILTTSPVIYDLAGLVSLSFSTKAYPSVLSINGFFPGILAFLNQDKKRRIIYASTQRLQVTAKRNDLKPWVTQTVNEFYALIPHILNQDNLEKTVLSYSENYLIKHPAPEGLNIYDVSKALGEEFLKSNQESFILRVSSCYGPNCSLRRTVGRLIFTRFLGNSRVEKQEKRDYIFSSDLSNIFEKCLTLPFKKPYEINYVCAGKSVSKEYIYSKIVKYTSGKKGKLKIAKNSEKEIYYPPNTWVRKIMEKEQTSVEKGIAQTVEYVQNLYFGGSNSATIRKLEAMYDTIRQQTDERGIDLQKIKDVRDTFFTLDGDHWLVHEAFWKPTGIVFGFPFAPELKDRFSQMRSKILKSLQLKSQQYWLPPENQFHATVVSYSHYSEKGKNLVALPLSELPKATSIVAAYEPITIIFKGVVITTDGSLLAKGFVKNDDLFSLRDRLRLEIIGISQKPQTLIHVKLAQILDDVPYEDTERINRLFEYASISTYKFKHVRAANGEVLPFAS